jgi:hypothetical protein
MNQKVPLVIPKICAADAVLDLLQPTRACSEIPIAPRGAFSSPLCPHHFQNMVARSLP